MKISFWCFTDETIYFYFHKYYVLSIQLNDFNYCVLAFTSLYYNIALFQINHQNAEQWPVSS